MRQKFILVIFFPVVLATIGLAIANWKLDFSAPFLLMALGLLFWLSALVRRPLFIQVDKLILWSKLSKSITSSRNLQQFYTLICALIFFLTALLIFVLALLLKLAQLKIVSSPIAWGTVLVILLCFYVYQKKVGKD